MSAVSRCFQMFVFSMPLFYHMSTTTQRLLLSFIYIHREDIPLSELTNFTEALFAAMSTLPTSGWIKMLVDLLAVFCSSRMKVCLDKRWGSGRIDIATGKELEYNDSPNVGHWSVGTNKDFCYTFSKHAADCASSVFSSLKQDEQHCLLWGPRCHILGLGGRQTEVEKDNDFADMEIEMNSEEFFDACNVAATQQTKTDDIVNIPSQQHASMQHFI